MKDVNVLINNGVNVQGSLELFGDMNMYDETLVDFLGAVDEKVNKLKKFKEISDMSNYAIIVHSLKSDARYLGFTNLAEIAYQHEIQSKGSNIAFIYNNFSLLMNEVNRIINVVKNYLGQENNLDSMVVETISEAVKMKEQSILVVDDSDIIRNFVHKIFNNDYEILHAKDGKEAIDVLGTSNSSIVAILLDLNMPKVDGFSVLDYLEENKLFAKIPVSIITGDDSKDTINRTFTYPITDVLQKPFNERDIKTILDKMIQLNKKY